MIGITNPRLEDFAKAVGLAAEKLTMHKYRGWTVSYDPPPIPWCGADWRALHPDYDASYEGPEDGWVSNGKSVEAATLEGLYAEIDAWIEENEA